MEDPRKTGLKNGLRQLTANQLQRVIEYPGEMVTDSVNYEDGKFCPLAIGIGLDHRIQDPTHKKVYDALIDLEYKVYNTRGIVGNFYTANRKEDLLEAAREVLAEKLSVGDWDCPCPESDGKKAHAYYCFYSGEKNSG